VEHHKRKKDIPVSKMEIFKRNDDGPFKMGDKVGLKVVKKKKKRILRSTLMHAADVLNSTRTNSKRNRQQLEG
jgi:hypothetical protein